MGPCLPPRGAPPSTTRLLVMTPTPTKSPLMRCPPPAPRRSPSSCLPSLCPLSLPPPSRPPPSSPSVYLHLSPFPFSPRSTRCLSPLLPLCLPPSLVQTPPSLQPLPPPPLAPALSHFFGCGLIRAILPAKEPLYPGQIKNVKLLVQPPQPETLYPFQLQSCKDESSLLSLLRLTCLCSHPPTSLWCVCPRVEEVSKAYGYHICTMDRPACEVHWKPMSLEYSVVTGIFRRHRFRCHQLESLFLAAPTSLISAETLHRGLSQNQVIL